MVKSTQRGFTLIELVVVIVILGILAAFAVPRFMGLEGDARAATVKSMGGALLSAATMARAKCQAQDCGAGGLIRIDGRDLRMQNGYPNRASIDMALDANALTGYRMSNPANGARRYTKIGGSTACWVEYVPAADANTPPSIRYAYALPANPNATQVSDFNRQLADACRG